MRQFLPIVLLCLAGCRGTLSPLSNKIKVGQESYLILVADGEADLGDLFASTTGGGSPFQLTFTRVDERLPALAPDGISLAFVRSRAPGDTTSQHVVVMNLLNGSERQVALPVGARVDAVAWSADGAHLYVQAGGQLLGSAAPPAVTALDPVPSTGTAVTDDPFRVVLGTPPAGMVTGCPGGSGLCVLLHDGSTVPLAPEGRGAVRWSGDSVAYLEGDGYVVRPLTGGRTRVLSWEPALRHPRQATMYPGSGVRDVPS